MPHSPLLSKQLRRTAHHEAGHAVLAHFLGIGLRAISVVADEEHFGHVIDGGEFSEDSEQLRVLAHEAFWIRMAVVRYAGAEAARVLDPKAKWRRGAYPDYLQADDAIVRITGEDEASLCSLRNYARRRARFLVQHYWPEIEALASELVIKGTIEPSSAVALMNATLTDRGGYLFNHCCPVKWVPA